jgi:hypothetical protein
MFWDWERQWGPATPRRNRAATRGAGAHLHPAPRRRAGAGAHRL